MAAPSRFGYRKGQTGILGLIAALVMFVLLWALWLGEWLAEAGQDFIVNNGLTGIEAFLIANLNLWVFCGLCVGIIFAVGVGASR